MKGLTCLPKYGFLDLFTFGEGHCGLPITSEIITTTESVLSNQQAVAIG